MYLMYYLSMISERNKTEMRTKTERKEKKNQLSGSVRAKGLHTISFLVDGEDHLVVLGYLVF